MGNETSGLIFARIDFPIFLDPAKAEQYFCDGSITLAAQAGIERAQGQDVKPPELGGHGSEIGARCPSVEGAPEATGGMSAKLHKGIHRQGCGIEGCGIGDCLRKPELMRNAVDLPEAMPAISSAAQIEVGQMRQRHYGLGRAAAMLHR